MGRHADPDPRHFWGSLGVACLRATLALALVVGLFAALSTVGGTPPGDGPVMLGEPDEPADERPETSMPGTGEPDPPPDVATDPDSDAADARPDDDEEAAEDAGVDPTDEAGNTEGEQRDATDPDAALLAAAPPPAETTVQVLDGVGASPLLDVLASELEAMGYEIVATNPARTDYAATTVLYSEGREAAAQALQARDPRIAERRPNPGLSEDVDLHVVLGADWRP